MVWCTPGWDRFVLNVTLLFVKTKFESSGTDELRATRQLTEATADLS